MIYFDHAATSYPKPESVIKAVEDCLRYAGGNPGRGGHQLSLAASSLVYDTRSAVAELLGIPDHPEKIIFVPNATFALNLAISTLTPFGAHVLISDIEHNAVFRPIFRLAKEGRLSYSIYSGRGKLQDEIEKKIKKESRVLLCNAVSNVTGRRIELGSAIHLSERYGLKLIVDASQLIGHFRPPADIDKIDAFCAPAHKGLYGIQGCGFVYFRNREEYPSFLDGGSGNESKNGDMPKALPERYEAGTLPTPAIAALHAGIDFVNNIGIDEIEEHQRKLSMRCIDMLASFPSIRIWAPEAPNTSLLSFSDNKLSPDYIANELDSVGIAVRAGYHCAPLAHDSEHTDPRGTVRLSFGIFNSESELDAFYRAIKKIIFVK